MPQAFMFNFFSIAMCLSVLNTTFRIERLNDRALILQSDKAAYKGFISLPRLCVRYSKLPIYDLRMN